MTIFTGSRTEENIWWDEMVGPHQLISDVKEALADNHPVILVIGDAFPWRWTFRGSVEADLDRTNHPLDCADEYRDQGVVRYFVEKLAPQKLNNFMCSVTISDEAWLKESEIMARQLVWVKGVPKDVTPDFIRFLRNYGHGGTTSGSILVEVETDEGLERLPRHIRVFRYSDYVHLADAQLFCNVLASRYNVPEPLREYAVSVTANLCGQDAELAKIIMEGTDFEHDDPLDRLRECWEAGMFPETHGVTDLEEGIPHPFELLRQGRQQELVRRVWKSQLHTAFPQIEMERLELIRRNEAQIRRALDMEYVDEKHGGRISRIEQFENIVENPYELELGTLVKMLCVRAADDTGLPLIVLTEPEKQRLHFLRDIRNGKLAHIYGNVNCTPEEMTEVLSRKQAWM